MDIKLKNNHKTKLKIVIIALLVLAVVTVGFFPAVNQRTRAILGERMETQSAGQEINQDMLKQLYEGSYVLYYEVMRQTGAEAADIYLEIMDDGDNSDMARELKEQVNGTLEMEAKQFEEYRSDIDYYIPLEENKYEKNTTQELEGVLYDARHEKLNEYYSDYFVLKFDAEGNLTIDSVYSKNNAEDAIVKSLGQIERENPVWGGLKEEYEEYEVICNLKKPADFTVVYGIPKTAQNQVELPLGDYMEGVNADYWEIMDASTSAGALILYTVILLLTGVLVWAMTNRKIWKTEIPMERPGKWYLMEAALVGIIWTISMQNSFIQMIWGCDFMASYDGLFAIIRSGRWMLYVADISLLVFYVFFLCGVWYLSLRFIRPAFTLGLREYIRQYSFIYQIYPWLQKKWNGLRDEVGHLDFSEKSTKTIVKIVVLNFIVLSICSFMWFFGIFVLAIYSVFLFLIIRKYYNKAGKDYQTLLKGIERIAQGNLDTPIVEDIGMFEPFKAEVFKIQTGFKKAVEEEVKSQRMKTELITNVSHDLKTPLTAITTYVELLKKEDITEEERRSYIETLEKKSQRLKVLIEDLFEVSKATTNNITLNPVEMDVVNLLKQVSVEHTEKFEQLGLDLRFHVPEEKVICMLDTQKTYRIFENLFGNVQKYAMPGSRVYVDVRRTEADSVEITIKNMSAQELNFKADEITERFVRGDSSRNTEGSGLGLAIAKSFTEAQGGKLSVEVDGDLFKVIIVF